MRPGLESIKRGGKRVSTSVSVNAKLYDALKSTYSMSKLLDYALECLYNECDIKDLNVKVPSHVRRGVFNNVPQGDGEGPLTVYIHMHDRTLNGCQIIQHNFYEKKKPLHLAGLVVEKDGSTFMARWDDDGNMTWRSDNKPIDYTYEIRANSLEEELELRKSVDAPKLA